MKEEEFGRTQQFTLVTMAVSRWNIEDRQVQRVAWGGGWMFFFWRSHRCIGSIGSLVIDLGARKASRWRQSADEWSGVPKPPSCWTCHYTGECLIVVM